MRPWIVAALFCITFATLTHVWYLPASSLSTAPKEVREVCPSSTALPTAAIVAPKPVELQALPVKEAVFDLRTFLEAPLPRVTGASSRSPLVFFHQGKTGGSWVRLALQQASERLKLRYYMPCNSKGVPCATYSMRAGFDGPPPTPAVIAGHFPWDDLRILSIGGALVNKGQKWEAPKHIRELSCFTVFRDPVARLESCYYHRFVKVLQIADASRRHTCLSSLTADEITSFFKDARDKQGFGCLNEPFRLLSGVRDEDWLADLGAAGFPAVLDRTLSHLSRCVPLILGDSRSLDVAQHWLPQFAPELEQHLLSTTGSSNRTDRSDRCVLSEEARGALAALAKEETALFEAVAARLGVFYNSLAHLKKK
jgi:hypothetical protein